MTLPSSRAPRRMPRALVLLLAGATVAGACGEGGDPLTPVTAADVTGTYRLVTVRGNPLPWADTSAAGSGTTLVSAELTLRADGVVIARKRSRHGSADAPTVERVDSVARWTLNPPGVSGPNVVRTLYHLPGSPGAPGTIHRPSVTNEEDYRAEQGGRRLRTMVSIGTLAAPGDVWVR